MIIKTHKNFDKTYLKLSSEKKGKVDTVITIFRDTPFSPELRNHALKGEHKGTRSISAGGDLRIHYRDEGDHIVVFLLTIGTHSELY